MPQAAPATVNAIVPLLTTMQCLALVYRAMRPSKRAVFFDSVQISSSLASTTDSFNFSPDDLFQKMRDFISIEVSIFNPKNMINNIFTGFNESIRDITGVDIVKFSGFITGLFYRAFSWLTELLQNFKSG